METQLTARLPESSSAPIWKRCSRCKETRPVREFHRRPSASDGLMSHCKSCNATKARNWRKANPDKRRALDRRYDGSRWAAYLWRTYRFTVAEYDQLLSLQQGKCAICKCSAPGGRTTKMHVDHDHATGKIRGLLCSKCNQMLGYANDLAGTLIAAAFYLNAQVAKAFIEAYIAVRSGA